MTSADFAVADLEIMSRAVNYRDWILRKISPFLGQRILEVGAGIGNLTELLLDRDLVVGMDVSKSCLDRMVARLGGRLKVDPIQMDVADLNSKDFGKYQFDTVVCLNVLEHVEDHDRALSNIHGVLVPGGRLVLLVPAFQFLYGTVDRELQHFRRYTRKELLPRMKQAGFQIETSFYMNVIGMAGWFMNNRVFKRHEESPGQVLLFDRMIVPIARRIEAMIPPPLGLSLIAIGKK